VLPECRHPARRRHAVPGGAQWRALRLSRSARVLGGARTTVGYSIMCHTYKPIPPCASHCPSRPVYAPSSNAPSREYLRALDGAAHHHPNVQHACCGFEGRLSAVHRTCVARTGRRQRRERRRRDGRKWCRSKCRRCACATAYSARGVIRLEYPVSIPGSTRQCRTAQTSTQVCPTLPCSGHCVECAATDCRRVPREHPGDMCTHADTHTRTLCVSTFTSIHTDTHTHTHTHTHIGL
jgi:hypothetical protein